MMTYFATIIRFKMHNDDHNQRHAHDTKINQGCYYSTDRRRQTRFCGEITVLSPSVGDKSMLRLDKLVESLAHLKDEAQLPALKAITFSLWRRSFF